MVLDAGELARARRRQGRHALPRRLLAGHAAVSGPGIADALRYYLLRHIRSTGDGDLSIECFRQAYESELAAQLGNFAHRALSMIERCCGGVAPPPPETTLMEDRLAAAAARLPEVVAARVQAFAFGRALEAICAFVAEANRYVSEEQPWALATRAAASADPDDAAEGSARLHARLFSLAVALQSIATCLAPVLPSASRRLLDKLGATEDMDGRGAPLALIGRRIEAGVPLFPMR